MPLDTQLLDTWRINNRVNLLMLEQIPDDALSATLSTRGGRDIARQFGHIHMNRIYRLKPTARKQRVKLIEFATKVSPTRPQLVEALTQSGNLMTMYLTQSLENGGEVSNFKRGVIPMLGYFIAHESHHRGSIILTLKQTGFKLPEQLKFGIWEWNKL